MDECLRLDGYAAPRPRARRFEEKGRDPYDGLRTWSAFTHAVGAVLAVVGTALLLVRAAAWRLSPWAVTAFAVYGASMIALYTASTLYHCLNTGVRTRLALRKWDHCSIYLLIAGTYTPVCLLPLRQAGAWGWSLFGVIWGLTLVGIVMTLFWVNAPRWVTSGVYLFMGWLAILAIYPLWRTMGAQGVTWLLAGGILYTVGGVLYALKWPGRDNPRFGCHEIFHLFILAGSACHFFMVYQVFSRL